ncbi:hypothetical protein LCGC14_1810710, partial [marine sediment metagenome]
MTATHPPLTIKVSENLVQRLEHCLLSIVAGEGFEPSTSWVMSPSELPSTLSRNTNIQQFIVKFHVSWIKIPCLGVDCYLELVYYGAIIRIMARFILFSVLSALRQLPDLVKRSADWDLKGTTLLELINADG